MSALDWSMPFGSLRVGEGFRTRGRTVTEADIVAFASLTGDWHPQHCDAVWAARSRFGERVAHGMLILSYAVGLVPLEPSRVLALRRVRDVVFKRPVTLGQTIRVQGEIAGLTTVDESVGLVAFDWAVRNETDALVCRAQVDVLWSAGAEEISPGVVEASATGDPIGFPPGVIPC